MRCCDSIVEIFKIAIYHIPFIRVNPIFPDHIKFTAGCKAPAIHHIYIECVVVVVEIAVVTDVVLNISIAASYRIKIVRLVISKKLLLATVSR